MELRGFEFFSTRTAPEMSYFHSEFWRVLVLQLSWSDPLILHAAIALGTLHENEERLKMPISKDRIYDPRHRFGVAQYNKAIRLLTSRKMDGDKNVKIAALVTCLLFIHIEFLRGHNHLAVAHIRGGIKILQRCETGPLHKGAITITDDIKSILEETFRRLDLQTAHFDSGGPFLQYDCPGLNEKDPVSFFTGSQQLAEAKRQSDLLLGCSFVFLEKCRTARAGERDLDPAVVAEQKSRLLNLFENYREALGNLEHRFFISGRQDHYNAVLLLMMHTIAVYVQVSVLTTVHEEQSYDAHITDFREIISLAKRFMASAQDAPKHPSLSTDWGIVPPLFFAAVLCHDPSIRREAISFLESWPRREGFWNSCFFAKIAGTVMEVEEGMMINSPQRSPRLARRRSLYAETADDQTHSTIAFKRDGWLTESPVPEAFKVEH